MTSYLLQFVLDIFTEALLVDQIKLEKKHLDYCNKSDQRIAFIATSCGVLAIAFWGLLALLGRLTEKVPALQLLFMCFLISTLILFVKRILNGQKVFSSPSLSAKQWVIGTGCLFGYHLGFFVALKLAPAIEVTLINYLWPLLLALMLAISTKNK